MKWLLRLIGVVVLVAAVAVGSLLLLPGERLARIASDQLTAQLGRDVSISGDVSLSFYPVLGVSTGPIRIANADWAGDTPMFRAASATIALETLPLLQRDIRVKGLHADGPDILLQRDAEGRANWDFSDGSGSQGGGASVSRFSIEDLTLTGGAVRIEQPGAAPVAYRDVDVALTWPDASGPADLRVVLRPAGTEVTITANLASPLNFMAGGAHPVKARLATRGGSVDFSGKAGLDGQAQGQLVADLTSTSGFLSSLGLGGADLPRGLGQVIDVQTEMTVTADQRVSLRGLTAALDHNRLSGAMDIFLAGKPRVNGKLQAGALDLSALTEGESSSGSSDGWSKTPIDASALALFDGEVLIDADSLDLGTLKFGKTRILVTNDNSRAVFSIRELQGYEGGFSGQFVINNRNGLSVGGDLTGRNVEAKALLKDLTGTDRLSGKADAQIEFLGVGQSVDAIVASLKGKGAFTFGRGIIAGIDLDRIMRGGAIGGGTTIFDSLAATWDIGSGTIRNDDLAMVLAALNAEGDGKVNLHDRSIDYVFTPRLLKARDGKGLAIPVRIKGSWSNPRITADLDKAIEMNFSEEKKKLENEVKKRIGEELGIETQEGESLEDAVKKKVEDELLKGLGGLLSGRN